MKKLLTILIILPGLLRAQRIDRTISPAEYTTTGLSHDSAFDLTQGKPAFIMKGIAKIAGGAHHYLLLGTDGRGYGAGDNSCGELGIGSTTGQATPTLITTDSLGNAITFTDIICGTSAYAPYWISAGIGTDSNLYVWGITQGGALGNGTYGTAASTRPVKVNFGAGVKIKKVQIGAIMIALDYSGNVYTWGGGNSYWTYTLGQGASPNYFSPTQITLASGVTAIDIAGGSFWNFAIGSNGHTYYFGHEYYLDYGTFVSGSAQNTPRDITANFTAAGITSNLAKIAVNSEASYGITVDSQLVAWGGNAVGTMGNGVELDFSRYGYPFPYGTTTAHPYAWSQTAHENDQITPIIIAPGIHDWVAIYATNGLNYNYYAKRRDLRLYAAGRNKLSICYGIVAGNPSNGSMQSTYPNGWDCPYLKEVDPWAVTTVYQSPAPYCIANPSATGCSVYTIPTHSAPTASLTATIVGSKICLDNSGSAPTDSRFIAYNIITQTSGTVLQMGVQDAKKDTIAAGSNGTYRFKVKVINDNWDSTFATATAIVGGTPTVSAGSNQTITATSATLSGTVTPAAGNPSGTQLWTKISGPGTTTITGNTTLNPTASGLQTGAYVFQLSGTDANGNNATSQVQVTVSSTTAANKLTLRVRVKFK